MRHARSPHAREWVDETACRTSGSGAHVHGGFGTGASERPRMPTLGTHRAPGVEIEVEVLRPLLLRMALLKYVLGEPPG